MKTLRVIALLTLAGLTSCSPAESSARAGDDAPDVTHAVCTLAPTDGNAAAGVVHFEKVADGIKITARVTGLTPGSHGFHVHQWGNLDCGDGTCTGGHFNPDGKNHGAPDDAERHVGDFGNLEADAAGVASYERVDRMVKLSGAHSVIGRAIIVHAAADDLKTQPTGAAGARVAYGVIGIMEPPKK